MSQFNVAMSWVCNAQITIEANTFMEARQQALDCGKSLMIWAICDDEVRSVPQSLQIVAIAPVEAP